MNRHSRAIQCADKIFLINMMSVFYWKLPDWKYQGQELNQDRLSTNFKATNEHVKETSAFL